MDGRRLKGFRARLERRAPWRVVGRPLAFAAQSIVDFLVEDRCVICRGSGRTGLLVDAPHRLLTAPVRHRIGLGLSVTNRPVCAACAAVFAAAVHRGRLARVNGDGSISTARGERFGEAPDTPVSAPAADRAWIPLKSPFMTNDNALRLVHLMKYSGYTALTELIAATMAWSLAQAPPPPGAVLLPVPMHPHERRRRGGSHTERLARAVSRRSAVPAAFELIDKTGMTRRQSTTRESERAGNVRGAFRCRGRVDSPVVLVDDLATTGATAAACCAELLRVGAPHVEVLCFARSL